MRTLKTEEIDGTLYRDTAMRRATSASNQRDEQNRQDPRLDRGDLVAAAVEPIGFVLAHITDMHDRPGCDHPCRP